MTECLAILTLSRSVPNTCRQFSYLEEPPWQKLGRFCFLNGKKEKVRRGRVNSFAVTLFVC